MNKERYSFPEPEGVEHHRMMPGESITPYEKQERDKSAKHADTLVKKADESALKNGRALNEEEKKAIWQEAFLKAEKARLVREKKPDTSRDY